MISPEHPYPPTQGSKVDIWGHVRFFQQSGCRVVLVVCGPKMSEAELPIEIELHHVHRRSHYSWQREEKPEVLAAVQALVDSSRPDIVWVEYAHLARLISALDLRGAELWFRAHNFELPHHLGNVLAAPLPLELRQPRKSYAWVKDLGRRLAFIFSTEKIMHRIADRIFYISCGDMKIMSKIYRGPVVRKWVGPFLECDQIPFKEEKRPLDVVYVGAPTHKPNLVGAQKLLDEVIPAVEAALPDAFRFHLVGKGGDKHFHQYASEKIVIHDFVEDLAGLLAQMDVACIPVTTGWGCKIKMVEALASGLPVVGSAQTFRGVPQTEGAYYSCQSVGDYVEALRQLQTSDVRRRRAAAGRAAYTAWAAEGESVLRLSIESVAGRAD